MRDLVCTVISYVPFDIEEFKPGLIPPRYQIKASDGEAPSVLVISNAIHYVYLDTDRGSLQVRTPCDEVAKSIVNDYCSSQLGIGNSAKPALFWISGELDNETLKSKSYQLRAAEAKQLQKNWFLNICRMADDDWTRYHKHNVISDFQRTTARFLGWKPDEHKWMSDAVEEIQDLRTAQCPHCLSPIHPKATVCAVCTRDVKPVAA